MLKIITKKEYEKLPKELKEHFAEEAGGFVPQVEGMVPEVRFNEMKAKLAEFRDSNCSLFKTAAVEREVTSVALRAGIGLESLPFVVDRAHKTFALVDGEIRAFDKNGLRYSKDGVSPLSIGEWVGSLPRPFFMPSHGGGAIGGRGRR